MLKRAWHIPMPRGVCVNILTIRIQVNKMTEQLTIQDGLSELKLINQKLERNNQLIRTYSSKKEGDPDQIENQKEYMKGLIQAGNDLLKRYLGIKIAIQKANLFASFEFEGTSYTLAEALVYKQGLLDMYEQLVNSLSSRTADESIRRSGITGNIGQLDEDQLKALKLVPKLFYSEEKKQAKLDELLELRAHLDRLIDKLNHQTILNI